MSVLAAVLAMITAPNAGSQTPPGVPGAATDLPDVIDSCIYYPAPSKDRLCQSWVRAVDRYQPIGPNTIGTASVRKFDRVNAVFVQSGQTTLTFSGKITGTRLEGMVLWGSAESGPTMKWAGRFFRRPSGDAAAGSRVYAMCAGKVSVVNTANHSVVTVDLNNDPNKPAGAITVSRDSSKAWVSTLDPGWKATLFAIDGVGGTITQTIPLQNTPIPQGATSLAVSGDGSTLYAAGISKERAVVVTFDAATGALKATQPLAKGYTGGELTLNPRLVISGTNLVLDDGTVQDTAVPGPAIFGSDAHGVAAFPDGKRICSLSTYEKRGNNAVLGQPGIVEIGTKAIQQRRGCTAVSPDGTKTYSAGQQLRSESGTAQSNPDFGAVVGLMWGNSAGITQDGKIIYTAARNSGMVYTIDPATNLTTDAIPVCQGPLLGMSPYAR
jgi:YVTN family beta-propeller protein